MNAAAVLALLVLQTLPPAASPSPAATGTAVVRGQVTEKDTGRPLPRSLVSLRFVQSGPRQVRQHLTDPEGRFEFTNVPAAAMEVSAAPGENRATHIPQVFQPTTGKNPAFKLAEGEVRADVNIALPRALAIAGRVVDEEGAPLSRIDVTTKIVPGDRVPPSLGYSHRTDSTDDRGAFRIFGLAPGRYIVCGASNPYPASVKFVGPSAPERFVLSCHPSAVSDSDAQIVALDSADVEGIEIRMRRSAAYSISGTIVDATGTPVDRVGLSLVRFVPGGTHTSGGSPADGRFTFSGLTSGDYAVRASAGGSEPPDGREVQRGFVPVRLDAANVDGVVVTLKPPATVQGRMTFEDAPPALRAGTRLAVTPQHDNQSSRLGSESIGGPAPVADDFTFTLKGLFGPQRLAIDNLPPPWVVKSMRYRGEEIADVPTEFVTDPRHQIEIVLTSRVAIVSGTVTDDTGNTAADARIVLLPAAVARWPSDLYQYPFATPGRGGRFTLRGVRPGEYLIVAVNAKQYDALRSQGASADALVKHAERVTLVENDRLTMTLRLVSLVR